MVKTMKRIMIVMFMSLLLAACGMNQNDGEDFEEEHNLPMDERNNDENNLPMDERNNDEPIDDESDNLIDRDPEGENQLPELETEDENWEKE